MTRYIVETAEDTEVSIVEFFSYAGALDYYMETIKGPAPPLRVRFLKIKDNGAMKVITSAYCGVE